MRPVRRLFQNRALDALAKSLICFALLHQILLAVHVARGGDFAALNIFTMLEAERLMPALGRGVAAQLFSGVFALLVYGTVWVLWTRTRRLDDARGRRLALGLFHPGLGSGALVFMTGLLVHNACLTAIERLTSHFPSVPDVLMSRLPYVAFGLPGELGFLAFLIVVATVLIRAQPRTVPSVLVKLGLFYAFRGLFLFFLPIGPPFDAPALENRFVLYPWANHAYFPGGHVGLMTILSLSVQERRWRRILLIATGSFALGTLLARTHYTADALGGWLLAYAVISWGRRHLAAPQSSRPAFAEQEPGREASGARRAAGS
jgi:hypothetical protein